MAVTAGTGGAKAMISPQVERAIDDLHIAIGNMAANREWTLMESRRQHKEIIARLQEKLEEKQDD